MFWADRLAKEIEEKHGKGATVRIRDEKTMSGWAHIGSMLSASIHGTISEALAEQNIKNLYFFEFNDMDAFDSVPVYLESKKFEEHLGKSLRDVPSPDGKASSYATYFANDFRGVIEGAGFNPDFDFSSDWYFSGKMDGVICEALEGAETIRRIYKEVSGGERQDQWLPLLTKCPRCSKIATTEAEAFDGETVKLHCRVDKVEYTRGCGFEGRISPFGGNAKLPWKVEWAAKWKVRNVMVEGGGKDHGTRGGAHEVADRISREVFMYDTPYFFAHEFFLVGGKKISSSKGLGSTARAVFELLPQKMFRLSLLGKDINQQRNFDPEGDSIPILYDQYDKLAENYWAGTKDDYARLFEVIHLFEPEGSSESERPARQIPSTSVLPRFSQVAFVVQMPHMDLAQEFSGADPHELEERAAYAKKWLEAYAPEKYVFKLQDTLPEAANNLTDAQKSAVKALADFIESQSNMPSGEALHTKLHELKEFKAIYLLFLGKESGPKAGWFLSVLPRDFVLRRLHEASV
ncbi:MAG: lysine--tRNA ligase [Patescibacteria group bacterium]